MERLIIICHQFINCIEFSLMMFCFWVWVCFLRISLFRSQEAGDVIDMSWCRVTVNSFTSFNLATFLQSTAFTLTLPNKTWCLSLRVLCTLLLVLAVWTVLYYPLWPDFSRPGCECGGMVPGWCGPVAGTATDIFNNVDTGTLEEYSHLPDNDTSDTPPRHGT